jgi:predicted metal-binding protein
MSRIIKRGRASTASPRWESLVLICKDCRHRKDGPKHLKARTLAKETKHQVKSATPRARVVLTSCLKLCPRKAISVAFVASFSKPRIAAIKSSAQMEDTLSPFLDRESKGGKKTPS